MCEKNNISAYKVLLKEMGIIKTAKMRAPMEMLSEAEQEKLLQDMRKADFNHIILE